jgi:presenilin-like A22 family membrane protease
MMSVIVFVWHVFSVYKSIDVYITKRLIDLIEIINEKFSGEQ